ncbi:hypothetical protein LDENG_00087160 [Lucifuga dentata]|nr:hypothetical protein LDENG_00087160 [Lucifuga dentata]
MWSIQVTLLSVSLQESDKLLARVDAAKAKAEDALRRINKSADELDDALRTLTGFDQQMEDSRTLANAAIKRLPAINDTIQQAVRDNAETQSVLDNMTGDYNHTLGTVNLLENLVTGLQGTSGSLPPYSGLLQDATRLNEDLSAELDDAWRLEHEAEEASIGAAAAFRNAWNTRDAVGKTLRDINKLLGAIGQSGSVDEQQLSELEESVADAHRKVNQWLKPQLRDMEEQEDAHRRRLNNINLDIDNILKDIANLEDILRSIPVGCFNSPPIEDP